MCILRLFFRLVLIVVFFIFLVGFFCVVDVCDVVLIK